MMIGFAAFGLQRAYFVVAQVRLGVYEQSVGRGELLPRDPVGISMGADENIYRIFDPDITRECPRCRQHYPVPHGEGSLSMLQASYQLHEKVQRMLPRDVTRRACHVGRKIAQEQGRLAVNDGSKFSLCARCQRRDRRASRSSR